MDKRILDFIEAQTVATICCVDSTGKPYCFNNFYAFDNYMTGLYFKSSANTRHIECMQKNLSIAGTILPHKLNTLAIKGIQFTGCAYELNNTEKVHAKSFYHSKYPFALAMPGQLWAIRLLTIKMTDNTLGFGHKITWSYDDASFVSSH